MLDLSSSYKYERNFGSNRDVKNIREGASFSKLFKSANICEVPAVAKLEMLNWSIYNLIIGNCDAHGKNFSFFVNKVGIRPTPFYDLLCILAHKDVEYELAFAYGDEFDPNKIKAYELRAFAEDIGVNFKLVSQTIDRLSNAITKALDDSVIDIDMLNKQEIAFVKRLKKLILQRAVDLKESAIEMAFITY
jgi:serine/threonine-protein kinase HipA